MQNPDMIGHTGDLDCRHCMPCEAVDTGLAVCVEALRNVGRGDDVTADHGNCGNMIDPTTGGAHRQHH